jgi:hypothetical protein
VTAGDPDQGAAAPRPSFGRSLGLFWLYTSLRFALFGVLWLILWLVRVEWLVAGAIAVALSIPLSWFLLAKPRQAFAANIEQRVNVRAVRAADLSARLEGDRTRRDDDDDLSDDPIDPNGPSAR